MLNYNYILYFGLSRDFTGRILSVLDWTPVGSETSQVVMIRDITLHYRS